MLLAHLRAGTVRVREGEAVAVGQELGECGNSGNSTQPHVHVQVMDAADARVAQGLPMAFRGYRGWSRSGGPPDAVEVGIPDEAQVVEPL
ncbi:M23 family metallopeptidase [Pseudonocardia humida]|uniref:M23 family metallopeptidase n=1 Tax=Pseudonocardia humida TaxID=2800819 RepID=A0ABT0ZV51_9PSEU|nr:peptidoglycan DD-metalloendopeptidase family protein [Pseudonocardia humida]MCO1654554.1 M23 family metallopeptidase [Pseudonocardia humida]